MSISLLALLWLAAAPADMPKPLSIDLADFAAKAAAAEDRNWKRYAEADPQPNNGCRHFMAYAMALGECGQHPERFERLFELLLRMQNADEKSPTYGNLRWYWRDAGVTDQNAVEFCMHDGLLLWLRQRERIPEPARKLLEKWLRQGIEGCLRHRVPTSYTNIAMLNAGNLIVAGETFGRTDAVEEGSRRLDAICQYTYFYGTHEYCSPTYYAVDLEGAALIRNLARSPRAVQQAEALWNVFWTDIALNWFHPSQRLGGSQSRSYDYVRGLGSLDTHLWLAGWLQEDFKPSLDRLHALMTWHAPTSAHWALTQQYPRLLRQRWGATPTEARVHWLARDITLSSSSAVYGAARHDFPLTIDLPGQRSLARCFSVCDGREDPYGMNRYPTSSAGHMKALHLENFWTAAQRRCDALALAVYRPEDLKDPKPSTSPIAETGPKGEIINCQTHLVLRRQADAIFVNGQPATLPMGTGKIEIGAAQPVVLRYGTAAIGVRVVLARAQDGGAAPVYLIDDGNKYGCIRLTVEHLRSEKSIEAAAGLWVRVGSDLGTPAAFEAWRKGFEAASAVRCDANPQRIDMSVPGIDGPVSVSAEAPYGKAAIRLTPAPTTAMMELDGREIGRPMLETVEPIKSSKPKINPAEPLRVAAGAATKWEAEDGMILSGMRVRTDPEASAAHYIVQPSEGFASHRTSAASYVLKVEKPGRYWLWGRTIARNPESDSFYLKLFDEQNQTLATGAWHLQLGSAWRWQPVTFERAKTPVALELPTGRVTLQIEAREADAQLDQLLLTDDENFIPDGAKPRKAAGSGTRSKQP